MLIMEERGEDMKRGVRAVVLVMVAPTPSSAGSMPSKSLAASHEAVK